MMVMNRVGWTNRGALADRSGVRGVVLSHLIGIAILIQFVLERAVTFELPYNRIVDLPIRLIIVWLLLDRIGRIGRVKVNAWDWLHLFFLSAYGFASVYADLFMSRDTGLINYITWSLQVVQPYFYFLAVREGLNRKGFRVDIVLRWIIFTVAVCCAIALLQALDIANMRYHINEFYAQRKAESQMEGPSAPWQARGVAAHANTMAMIILFGMVALVAYVNQRKLGWIELASGALFMGTLFATYSRTGIVTAAIMGGAFVLLLVLQQRYRAAFLVLFGLAGLLFAFVSAVFAFNIERYQVFVKGVGVVKKEPSRGLYGVYARQESFNKAIELGSKYPITGVSPASSLLNRQRIITSSPYAFDGLVLNVFAYTFVQFGMYGLTYLFGILGVCLSFLRYARTKQTFAAPAFFAGVVLFATGMTENTLFALAPMIIVNVVMAAALNKVVATEKSPQRSPIWLRGLTA